MANTPGNRVKTESINEIVIRLLGLKDGIELDYKTYFELLKKKLAISRLVGKELPREEDELLRNELIRVRRIKEQGLRFKVKKAKITSSNVVGSTPTQKPSGSYYQGKKTSNAIVKRKGEIVVSKGGQLAPLDTAPKKEEKEQKGFTNIKKTLDSILSILASKFKFEKKESDNQRKEEEKKKRGKKESTLEGFKKGFKEIVSLTKKMLSPIEEVIERIKKFIFFTLLGRGFTMFMDWMKNKENQKKFESLVKFFTDHWPAIAGLYILFGTSFGKLIRGLLKASVRMTVALVANLPRIISFIKKNRKLAVVIGAALPFASKFLSDIFTSKENKKAEISDDGTTELQDAKNTLERTKDFNTPGTNVGISKPSTLNQQKPSNTKIPAKNLGGMIPSMRMPKFNAGGFIPQFAIGGMNPYSGLDFHQGVPITGAGKDDTLIAAKTGEAVLTEKDQQELNQRYVDRETGQPLNIPQFLSDRKSSFVNLNNIRIGGGYYKGGLIGNISKFNYGGVVGGGSGGPGSFTNVSIPGLGGDPGTIPRFASGGLIDSVSGPGGFANVSIPGFAGGPGTIPRLASGGIIENVSSLWNRITNRKSTYNKTGPEFTSDIKTGLLRRQPQSLTKSAQSLLDTRWSASSVGVNPTVGCAASIKEVYKRAGINLPWPKSVNANFVPDIYSFLNRSFLNINEEKRKPGDIVIWEDNKNPPYGHIGIVMPDGRIANNSSSKGTFTNLNTPQEARSWWPNTKRLIYFRDPKVQQASDFSSKTKLNNKGLKTGNLFASLLTNLTGKKQKGGIIKENTGMNIPGATADRQLSALQPGEYVLPVNTVNRLGLPLIEKIVALTDSNSDAYLKRGKVNRPIITPYRNFGASGSSGIINLPPIISSEGGLNRPRASGLSGGTEVPSFSAVSPHNERAKNASIYGLVG